MGTASQSSGTGPDPFANDEDTMRGVRAGEVLHEARAEFHGALVGEESAVKAPHFVAQLRFHPRTQGDPDMTMNTMAALALSLAFAAQAAGAPCVNLHAAALTGDVEAIEVLIAAGVDPNARADDGDTPLHRAADEGHAEAVAALLASDADPNAMNDDGDMPLHFAVSRGDVEAIEALLAAGADPNAETRYTSHGHTPLFIAVGHRHPDAEVIRALLAAGADPDVRHNGGYTPLHHAVWHTTVEVIAALLAATNPNSTDMNGNTPLHHAAFTGRFDAIEVLIAAGADPNARADDGDTPLHDAAGEAQTETIAALLASGADPDARNNDGLTPRDVLNARYAPAIAALTD